MELYTNKIMSKKTQHNNILLAALGFTAVVAVVALIGFFTLGEKDRSIQGQVEVTEYRDRKSTRLNSSHTS